LISQLSFISLLSIEMLSDCVISGLYMRVLKLTLKNLISVNFFSIFILFQCEASGRSLLTSGRISVRTVLFWSPDGNGAQSSGRDLVESGRSRQPPDGRLVKPFGRV